MAQDSKSLVDIQTDFIETWVDRDSDRITLFFEDRGLTLDFEISEFFEFSQDINKIAHKLDILELKDKYILGFHSNKGVKSLKIPEFTLFSGIYHDNFIIDLPKDLVYTLVLEFPLPALRVAVPSTKATDVVLADIQHAIEEAIRGVYLESYGEECIDDFLPQVVDILSGITIKDLLLRKRILKFKTDSNSNRKITVESECEDNE